MEVTEANFAARIKRKRAAKAAHEGRAELARSRQGAKDRLNKAVEKIRSIGRSGSSAFAPHLDPKLSNLPEEDERSSQVFALPPDDEDKVQARLTLEFRLPKYRLTYRVGQQLGLDEALVQKVLAAVPLLFPKISTEKRLAERWIREIYAGEVKKLPSDRRGDRARHDSRVKHQKAGLASKRAIAVEL